MAGTTFPALTPVVAIDIPKEWKQEAMKIEKAKKTENKITYINQSTNQISAFGGHSRNYNNNYAFGYGGYADIDTLALKEEEPQKKTPAYDGITKVSQEETEKMEELLIKMESNELQYHDFIEQCRKHCPNIDPHSYIDAQSGFNPIY